MRLLQETLRDSTRFFSSSHPPKPPYGGKGWLAKVETEYRYRFGIDLQNLAAAFSRIQELVLARNAGIHRDPRSMDKYLRSIEAPRFVDNDGEFWLTEKVLIETIKDCKQFVDRVVAELKKLRPAKPAELSYLRCAFYDRFFNSVQNDSLRLRLI